MRGGIGKTLFISDRKGEKGRKHGLPASSSALVICRVRFKLYAALTNVLLNSQITDLELVRYRTALLMQGVPAGFCPTLLLADQLAL